MTTLRNQQIELAKLVIHPNNVRGDQDYNEEGIKALARNIAAFGLFQNLVVQPLDTGNYGVLGGGRRLKALQHLDGSDQLDLPKIPCRVVSKDMPWQTAISLAENAMQERMNPIDEYDAFAAMVDQGQTSEKIAEAFGITVRQVTERLRYGRVHPAIRAAARNSEITLDALKAFAVHPCQETQKRVFDDLSTKGAVHDWSVRHRLKEADIVLGDPIARFVADDYRARDGEVIPALFDDETVLRDRGLVETIAIEKLQAKADEIAATHGFAWAEGRMTLDYGEVSTFGRIYPERGEPGGEDAARLEAIRNELETLDDKIGEAKDDDALAALAAACRNLEEEAEQIERACERYDPEHAANAGVIVTFSAHGPEVHAGLIRPDDKVITATESKVEEDASKKKDFALSRTLVEDLGVERANAIAASLLDQPDLAQDALLFAIAGQALAQDLVIPDIELRCHAAERSHSRPEARDEATLKVIEDAHRDLDLSWLDQGLSANQRFLAFQCLEPTMKGRIAAWCLGTLIAPGLVDGTERHGRDGFVQTVAAIALPDIRTRWLPTEANYWSRVTKGHMLNLLRAFGMNDAADDMRSAKKTTLAAYMGRLFAAPFKTLTPDQNAAVRVWAPHCMQTGMPPSEETGGEDALAA